MGYPQGWAGDRADAIRRAARALVSAWHQVITVLPRRFALIRHVDYTGVSGIGVVAYGVAFADGQIVLRWCSSHPATSMWASMDDLLAVHGHGEATSVEWIDAPLGDLEEVPASSRTGRRARRRPVPDDADDLAREAAPPAPWQAQRDGDAELTSPRPDTEHSGSDQQGAEEPEQRPEPAAWSPVEREPDGPPPPAAEPLPRRRVGLMDRERDEEERNERNGHLNIDTAPLLFDSSSGGARPPDRPPERPERPERSPSVTPLPRRGGRHRRRDPPAQPR